MSLDRETIAQHQALLATHRRMLAHLIQQAAAHGGEVFAPPVTAYGIAEARAAVQRIKAILQENDIDVVDDPNDYVPPPPEPAIPFDVPITKAINDNTVVIRCNHCEGTGREPYGGHFDKEKNKIVVRSWAQKPCEVCNGKILMRVQSDDTLIACSFYQGTGLHLVKAPDYSVMSYLTRVCPACKGVGAQSLTRELHVLH